jgi:serine/threonine protein kinase
MGVVHRDIRPANILRRKLSPEEKRKHKGEDEILTLIDFGGVVAQNTNHDFFGTLETASSSLLNILKQDDPPEFIQMTPADDMESLMKCLILTATHPFHSFEPSGVQTLKSLAVHWGDVFRTRFELPYSFSFLLRVMRKEGGCFVVRALLEKCSFLL